jgi:hypothetical protein
MEITEERFEDGKWKLTWSKKINVDLRKDQLKAKTIYENKPHRIYEDRAIFPDKMIRLTADLEDAEKDLFAPKRLLRAHAYVAPNIGRIKVAEWDTELPTMSFSNANFRWFYNPGYAKAQSLLEILQEPTFQNERWMKIKPQGEGLVLVQINTICRYYIDLAKGMPIKYVDIIGKEDGTIEENCSIEVTEFTLKNGWLFPTGILLTRNGKPETRQIIDPKTLKINELFSAKDFVVTVYPGTRVCDDLEKKEYIAGQKMTSANIKELETQLKNFAEEVRKSREKSKSETKEKKEQQKKEKQ